jgi:GNAT superfamily N-acetyltransferase
LIPGKNRYVDEYNRSEQTRIGHKLLKGIAQEMWAEIYSWNVAPMWLRSGNRNIGFVAFQEIYIGLTSETTQPIRVVSDVYVDPKFRGKGLLYATLKYCQSELNHKVILIDKQKLLNNANYYISLNYLYAKHWSEQELLMLSTEPLVDSELWFRLVPEKYSI